ncbi:HD-GYP domain-containing protein [Bacillus sp. CGMCC 1.16607]|uniref:HD-GYP domain-containing protein n=1 Tax=Bacillus sp. CGMCC 1.16607 TaxID=3351842 RepID=UPI003639C12B
MRLVATNTVKSGTILGKPIYNEKGQILLNEGVELAELVITRLLYLGIDYIYIKDKMTDDIIVNDSISEKVRKEALTTIELTFKELYTSPKKSQTFIMEKSSKKFTNLIRDLLTELKNNPNLLNLLSDVFTYDNYIFTHSLNVTMYTLAIGLELKLPQKDLEILGLGAILHDVGKMKIPEPILFKNGRLTEEEYEEVKKHAEAGFKMLKTVQTLPLLVAHCAYQHHERMNGSGYPRGITGNDIHLYGKIIAVADVFDAVTSNRVYRNAMLPHEGLEILYAGSDILFEPKIIEAFRKSVVIYPNGLTVELNDGRKGVVSAQNFGLSERPIVRILEEKGHHVPEPYELDLKIELSLIITNCDTTMKND